MTAVDVTARGGGYFTVYVNGARFSQHAQEREAVERCTHVLAAEPGAQVQYLHGRVGSPYRVTVELVSADVAVPDPAVPPPQSDGGEDLVDFIDRIQGEPTDVDFIAATSLEVAVPEFAEQTLDTWLVRRMYADVDGDGRGELVGIGWRGYVLLFHLRDRGALRVGSTP